MDWLPWWSTIPTPQVQFSNLISHIELENNEKKSLWGAEIASFLLEFLLMLSSFPHPFWRTKTKPVNELMPRKKVDDILPFLLLCFRTLVSSSIWPVNAQSNSKVTTDMMAKLIGQLRISFLPWTQIKCSWKLKSLNPGQLEHDGCKLDWFFLRIS